jgi:superfamily II DNA or RNA helicase
MKEFSYEETKWAIAGGRKKQYKKRTCLIKPFGIGFGLLKPVIEFCLANDFPVELDPVLEDRLKENEFDAKAALEFFRSFRFFSKGEEIFPRIDQLGAVFRAAALDRAINVAPTSFGKSLCVFMEILWNIEKRNVKKNLLIVPTIELANQMEADFRDYCWDGKNRLPHFPFLQVLYHGKPKKLFPQTQVLISTFQSLAQIAKKDKKFLHQFGAAILDEAHKGSAESIKLCLAGAINARFRTGWTGTLNERIIKKIEIESLVGPAKKIETTASLMERKIVADLSVKFIHARHPKSLKCSSYHEAVKILAEDPWKNSLILGVAGKQGSTGLILHERHSQGELLYAGARERFPEREVFLFNGEKLLFNGGEYKDFGSFKPMIEASRKAILICSYGVFSTGVSIKNINWIVFGSSTKSYVRAIQSIGRGLRISPSKKSVALYDIVDHLKGGRSYFEKHYQERKSMYEEAGFKIEEIEL